MENMELPRVNNDKKVIQHLMVTLEGEPLRQLLTTSAKAYNTEINDLLVTALCQSYHRLTDYTDLAIQMEGHGREPLHEPVVTDRTVGWFTSVYPVVIQAISGDIRSDVRHVKEQMRAVPNKGIGYGILQYIASQKGDAALRTDLTPLMGFNYLGEADNGKGIAAPHSQRENATLISSGVRNENKSGFILHFARFALSLYAKRAPR
jgi:bacitracin synthase 3